MAAAGRKYPDYRPSDLLPAAASLLHEREPAGAGLLSAGGVARCAGSRAARAHSRHVHNDRHDRSDQAKLDKFSNVENLIYLHLCQVVMEMECFRSYGTSTCLICTGTYFTFDCFQLCSVVDPDPVGLETYSRNRMWKNHSGSEPSRKN